MVQGAEADGGDVTAAPPALGPVTAPLERVRGQLGAADVRAGEEARPVDGRAAGPGLGERRAEPAGAALAAPQGAGDGGLVLTGFDALLHGGDEDGVRAGFDEQPVAVGEQGPDGGLEADGFAHVAAPVGGVEPGGVQRPAGDGRVEGHLSRPRREVGEVGHQSPRSGSTCGE